MIPAQTEPDSGHLSVGMMAERAILNQVGPVDMIEMRYFLRRGATVVRCHSRIFRFEAGYENDNIAGSWASDITDGRQKSPKVDFQVSFLQT